MKLWKSIRSKLRRRISAWRRRRFKTAYQSIVSDISLRLQENATAETADYVALHMPRVGSVNSWRSVHDIAIENALLEDGLVLEFGVFSGTTANYIVARSGWSLDAFDSFEGLPETWRDGYPKGKFARAEPPEVAASVTMHIGWFEDTLPKFVATLEENPRPVRYLHIDGDLYASAKTVLEHLSDRIVAGSVLVFDEYFNYPGWKDGEFRAFQEFVADYGVEYDYLTYNYEHQQVAVMIRRCKVQE